MSDEHHALAPAPSSPPPPTEADYEAIFAAVMETVRGRWFLSEFAHRNRHADTQMVLAAIDRLQASMHGEGSDPSFERIRTDIRDMADAIAATRQEIAAIRPDGEHTGIFEATEELDAIVMATERATSDILAAAETIQEMAWMLREQGLDGQSSDRLDACATAVYLACSFQDLTGQRTRKVIHVLRFLEERINAMVGILGVDTARPAERPASRHAPLDIDMDQAEIDAVMPAVHAAPAAPPTPAGPPLGEEPAAETAGSPPVSFTAGEARDDLEPDDGLPTSQAHAPATPETDPPPADVGTSRADEAEFRAGGEMDDRDDEAMIAPVAEEPDSTAPDTAFAGEPEDSADPEQPPAGGAQGRFGAATSTKALLADLLAIIRPVSPDQTSDGEDDPLGADALGADALGADAYATEAHGTEASSSDTDDSARDTIVEAPPEPLDIRLMQPSTPPSDFVLVPLGLESQAAERPMAVAADTDAAADQPADVTAIDTPTTDGPNAETRSDEATDPTSVDVVVFAESAEETSTPILTDREAASDEAADAVLTETLIVTAADAAIPADGDMEITPDDILAPEPVPSAATSDVVSDSVVGDGEAAPRGPVVADAGESDAGSHATVPDAALEDLDDDLLMGPADPPPADVPTGMPAAAEPDAVADADMDLLLPADADGSIDAAFAAGNGDPSPDAFADIGLAHPEPAETTATAGETVPEEAAEQAEPLQPTAEEPLSAPDREDEFPATFAAAFLGDDGALRHEGGATMSLDLAPSSAAAVAPLSVGATAALAALAMSATAAETGSADTLHEETGHIDPLAAVKALSIEERIALFS